VICDEQFASDNREQVDILYDEDDVCFVLNQHANLNFYSAGSLKQQSTDRLPKSDTLS